MEARSRRADACMSCLMSVSECVHTYAEYRADTQGTTEESHTFTHFSPSCTCTSHIPVCIQATVCTACLPAVQQATTPQVIRYCTHQPRQMCIPSPAAEGSVIEFRDCGVEEVSYFVHPVRLFISYHKCTGTVLYCTV